MIEPSLPDPERARSVAALLRWLEQSGVDTVLQEAPRDRFAETALEAEKRSRRAEPHARRAGEAVGETVIVAPPPPPAIARHPATSVAPPAAPTDMGAFPAFAAAMPEGQAMDDARMRARTASDLDELRAALADFTGCNLRLTAKSLVFGNGDPQASLMVVGEAPGREEDEAGEPFVGRSGRLLDRMLQAIGIDRGAVRVTNTVPWRPPGNRSPTPAETEMCLPFVMRQIELVRPKVLVCLGSPSAKAILSTEEGIMRLRGRWSELPLGADGAPIAVTAMLHPAYLLRQPAQKRLAWRDLLAVKSRLS